MDYTLIIFYSVQVDVWIRDVKLQESFKFKKEKVK